MKNFIQSTLILCVFFAVAANSKPWEAINKGGTLRAASEGTFSPFNFFKNGKLTGFEIDVVEAISKKLNLKTNWETKSFDALLLGLEPKLDRYDLVAASHGITPERQKVVDFSDPHYCTGVVIVSKKGGPKSLADLKGKVAAIEVGTIYSPTLVKTPGIKEVKTLKQDPECMQALLSGRADAWVTDKLVAEEAIKSHKDAVFVIGDTVLVEKVAMAVSKGNAELLKQINEGLAAIKKDGTYKKISLKYFNEDISCH